MQPSYPAVPKLEKPKRKKRAFGEHGHAPALQMRVTLDKASGLACLGFGRSHPRNFRDKVPARPVFSTVETAAHKPSGD
jgi:hypothetical protein